MRLTMQQKRHPQDEQIKAKLTELTETMQRLRKQPWNEGNFIRQDNVEWLEHFSSLLEDKLFSKMGLTSRAYVNIISVSQLANKHNG